MLVIGVAYKADVNDMRESPALKIIDLLVDEGAQVAYHDPHVPQLAKLGLQSVPLDAGAAQRPRCGRRRHGTRRHRLGLIAREAPLVVDFRNVVPDVDGKVWQPMTRDAVRLGVVGLNYWGPNLARNFDRLPDSELAYCCDLDEAILERHRPAFPTSTLTRRTSTTCSATTRSTPWSSRPRSRRTPTWRSGRWTRASTCSSKSPSR